jgi:signal transduction histidine kinase
MLKISDTGLGITVYLQPEIFNKLTTAGRTGQWRTSTGLGLCFTKECMENMMALSVLKASKVRVLSLMSHYNSM